jgi:hypothetical protein
LYSARDAYGPLVGLPANEPLSPAFWHNVTQVFETNDAAFQDYISRKSRGFEVTACTGDCKNTTICNLRALRSENNCVCDSILPVPEPFGYECLIHSNCYQAVASLASSFRRRDDSELPIATYTEPNHCELGIGHIMTEAMSQGKFANPVGVSPGRIFSEINTATLDCDGQTSTKPQLGLDQKVLESLRFLTGYEGAMSAHRGPYAEE